MTKKIIFLLLIGSILLTSCEKEDETEEHPPHWNYENPNWQNIGYTDCGGKVQTPINIITANTITSTDLSEVTFTYNPFPIKIIDNGHTVQVNSDANIVNTIEIDAITYTFLQFHYHTHSEHEIDGATDEMEIHLVHQDPISENIAVIGILLNSEGTTDNPFLESYLESFPTSENTEFISDNSIDLLELLPTDKKYYTYTGSLTTPPCSQGLKWILLKEKVKASTNQIEAFEQRHQVNARPIQPLNGRIVLEKI